MKQSCMFRRNDIARLFIDSSEDERDNDAHNDPMGSVFGAIQRQRAKQRVSFPKNNIFDPVAENIYNFIDPGMKNRTHDFEYFSSPQRGCVGTSTHISRNVCF